MHDVEVEVRRLLRQRYAGIALNKPAVKVHPSVLADGWAMDHHPACPRCGDLSVPRATVCLCGCRLTEKPS